MGTVSCYRQPQQHGIKEETVLSLPDYEIFKSDQLIITHVLLLVPFGTAALFAVPRLNVAVAEYHRVQFGGGRNRLLVAAASVLLLLMVLQYLRLCRVRRHRRGWSLLKVEEENMRH